MLEGSLIRDYKIITILHPGTGGNVYVVEDTQSKNNEKLVIKSCFIEELKKNEFEIMIAAWKDLSNECEFVVKIFDVFYERTNAFILMEFCEGGDLETLIKKRKLENNKFSEYEIMKTMSEIFRGMRAMHVLKLLHRDIKPANILIAKGVCKLADFNVSRVLKDADGGNSAFTFAGTFQYVAPEIFLNKGYSFSADVYSAGAVLYELIALAPAFPGMDIPSILANRYPPLDARVLGYSPALVQLVAKLLSLDPVLRPSAADALADAALADVHARGAAEEQRRQGAALARLQAQHDTQTEAVAVLQGKVQTQADTIERLQERVARQEAAMAQCVAALAELKAAAAAAAAVQVQAAERDKLVVAAAATKEGKNKICPTCRSPTKPRLSLFTSKCGKCGRIWQLEDWDHCDKCNKSYCKQCVIRA